MIEGFEEKRLQLKAKMQEIIEEIQRNACIPEKAKNPERYIKGEDKKLYKFISKQLEIIERYENSINTVK